MIWHTFIFVTETIYILAKQRPNGSLQKIIDVLSLKKSSKSYGESCSVNAIYSCFPT